MLAEIKNPAVLDESTFMRRLLFDQTTSTHVFLSGCTFNIKPPFPPSPPPTFSLFVGFSSPEEFETEVEKCFEDGARGGREVVEDTGVEGEAAEVVLFVLVVDAPMPVTAAFPALWVLVEFTRKREPEWFEKYPAI